MCGIAGIIKDEINAVNLQRALVSMKHRGPDGNGLFTDKPLTLLHTRLSIQDLSESAGQPMYSADKCFVIIFNGEIYNHHEIRKVLLAKGQLFRSGSDTETLLYAYIHFGTEALQMLNGIFAFAIYDIRKRQLFAARDSFGIKPFYYFSEAGIFTFASEVKTLLELTEIKRDLNADALFQTLVLQWQLGAETGLKEVKRLLPGHFLELSIDDAKCITIKKWAKEALQGKYEDHSEQEWIQRLDLVLNAAVERQLLSDKPIGYFLSGGLDSSLLLAIAHKIAPEKVTTAFTIDAGKSFQEEGFSADLPYAKLVAKHLGIDLDIIETPSSFLKDFDFMIYHLDEAQADSAPLFVREISRRAKLKGFDVLISGAGADDLFSGYRRHQALAYEKQIEQTPLFIRKAIKQGIAILPFNNQTRRLKKITGSLDKTSFQRMADYFFWSDPKLIQCLFTKEFLASIDAGHITQFFSDTLAAIPDEQDILNRMLHLEMNTFLPGHNLNYTDKMGMAESVEIRVPYLDNELVALAAKLPPQFKMKGTITKYLLKKVAEKYLPKEVIYRSKTGFGAPVRTWMQTDKQFQQQVWARLNSPAFIALNIFDQKAIKQLYQETTSNKKDYSYTLLSLLAIESWLRQFTGYAPVLKTEA